MKGEGLCNQQRKQYQEADDGRLNDEGERGRIFLIGPDFTAGLH